VRVCVSLLYSGRHGDQRSLLSTTGIFVSSTQLTIIKTRKEGTRRLKEKQNREGVGGALRRAGGDKAEVQA